jgi:methyl-accepting chemotaxis protein
MLRKSYRFEGTKLGQRSIGSLAVKAGAVVLGSTILAGVVGGGAAFMMSSALSKTSEIAGVLRNHLEADMMHDALRSDVLASLAARNPAYGLSMDEVKTDMQGHVEHFTDMVETNAVLTKGTELGAVVEAVKPGLEAYIATATKLIDTAATDEEAALGMLPGFFADFRKLEGAMSNASDQISAVADKAVADAGTIGIVAQLAMLAASLLAIGSVIAIVIGARKQVVAPIVDITAAMDRLAAGDTSVQAPHAKREDEIGRMAAAFSKFRENAINRVTLENAQRAQEAERAERSRRVEALAASFGDQLSANLSTLRESSNRLLGDAASLEQVCEEANHSARNAIDATAGANSNVQTIAAATTQLSASIQEIATRMTESARSAEMASSQGVAAGVTAQQLADAARSIDEIVSVIGSVAEQTNLLALNATIEAARAGEMGRGFAVVASEVKGLASQTSRATEDVSRRIGEIQGISTRSTGQLREIVALIEQMKQFSVAVAAAAEEQSSATNSIAENVNSAADRSEEARASVAAMSSVTAKTREATDSVQSSARAVEELTERMNSVARDFLEKLRAA